MDPIEEQIVEGLRATAPELSPDVKNRVRNRINTTGARRRPSGFAVVVSLSAAVLIAVQIVVVGTLDNQEQALMTGTGTGSSVQLASKSHLDGMAVAQAFHDRLRVTAALIAEGDLTTSYLKVRTGNDHVQ